MHTKILHPTEENLELASRLLREGEPVAIPTETVYGLAADALNEAAIAKVFAAKERPSHDPLIVHVARSVLDREDPLAELAQRGLITDFPMGSRAREIAARLARSFWPGPLTLLLPRGPRIPLSVTAGLDTVGIRIPRHPIALALLETADLALAAPSANRFGRVSPTKAPDVLEELGGRILAILDGGPCEVGIESTVVRVQRDGGVEILRPGGIALEEIERLIEVPLARPMPATSGTKIEAPGMLESHYAPATPVLFLPKRASLYSREELRELVSRGGPAPRRVGVLLASDPSSTDTSGLRARLTGLGIETEILVLSPLGNEEESARTLFEKLRELDRSNVELILADPMDSTHGLLRAVEDRLRRASRPR